MFQTIARNDRPSRRWPALRTTGAACLASVLAALSHGDVRAEPAAYRLDPDHLAVTFLVDHIGYASVTGMFLDVEGGFTFDEGSRTLTELEVSMDAASVFTNHEARDRHVRGGDFLDAEDHPTITFVGTSAEATGERTGRVTGDLTVRGVTRPVTFDVVWNRSGPYPFGENYVIGVSVRGVVQRSAFDMTYALDNGWVGDDVEVIIEAEAIRQ